MENSIEKELEVHVQQLINNELNNVEKDSPKERDKKTVTSKGSRTSQTWVSYGNFPNGCKKWRDQDNLICNGRLCGKCNRDRAGKTMKKMRSST